MGAEPGDREQRESHEEQRRRELEEIRDSFRQIGIRMGSLFEPAQEQRNGAADAKVPAKVPAPHTPELAPPPAPESHQRIPSWAVTAVIAVACLLAGGGLGFLLRSPAPAPVPIPTVVTQTVVRTETKPVAPRACLETARRGDQAMDLLVRNVRDRRLAAALKAYTTASQACRREASP
jgi:hypothetical protein